MVSYSLRLDGWFIFLFEHRIQFTMDVKFESLTFQSVFLISKKWVRDRKKRESELLSIYNTIARKT